MKTWIGIDTGGTFTDFVALFEDGTLLTQKLLSTPDDPSRAVLAGIAALARGALDITYGSTVATNALLERRGAKTAFITNKGFEDLLVLARQNRPHLYRLRVEPAAPLVAREHSFGVSGRLDAQGNELSPIDAQELASLSSLLRDSHIESVAICLLHSYANPSHEKKIVEALSALGVPISASCEIIPEYREYERAITTTVNAYVAPKMKSHLEHLAEGVSLFKPVTFGLDPEVHPEKPSDGSPVVRHTGRASEGLPEDDGRGTEPKNSLRVMQSNGGAIGASLAAKEPVRTVLSGPAGGVVGAFACAKQAGSSRIITFDMGGTSTDVSLCDGQIRSTSEGQVAGLPVRVPLVDVHTVGAGGGSIARIDLGGALKVGPESASAVPGPACYDKGGPVTVTDANVVLGRIDASYPLGGSLHIDAARSFTAMELLAAQLKKDVYQTAEGVIRVANAAMEKALRVVSVERGFDPRQFALLSFGGAGGLHACALAEALQMPEVIIPSLAGVLSAFGMLEADVSRDASKTLLTTLDMTPEQLAASFAPLEEQVTQELLQEGFAREHLYVSRTIDARYQGQSFEISLPYTRDLAATFEAEYRQRYGYILPHKTIELVTLRVRATGRHQQPARVVRLSSSSAVKPVKHQQTFYGGAPLAVPVYERASLGVGVSLDGPALVVETIATTWVASGWRATVHSSGALLLGRQVRSSFGFL